MLALGLTHGSLVRADEPQEQGRALQLEVFLNGETKHLVGSFQELPDGGLAATRQELKEVGIKPARDGPEEEMIALAAIPEVTYQYDEPRQRVDVTLPDERRMPHVIDAYGEHPSLEPVKAGWGGVLNYTLFGSTAARWDEKLVSFGGASAQLDARVFSPYGYIQQTGIVGSTVFDEAEILRLDTAYVYSNTEMATTYRAGDVISRGPLWSRPIRLGGLQAERNFGLRPDIITAPLPIASGTAAVPSTVDVFVDNVRTFSRDVPAGPFSITNLPTFSSTGTAKLLVRDASGRIVETSLPFFASPQLLREGYVDFSLQAGFPRFAYAVKANAYSEKPVGTGSIRYGLTDNFTLEAQAEAATDLVNGGVGLVTNAGALGVLALAGRASYSGERTGFQAYGSFETRLLGLSLGVSSQRSFGPFEDLASITSKLGYLDDYYSRLGRTQPRDPTLLDPLTTGSILRSGETPRAVDRLSIGVPLPARANVAVSLVNLERAGGDWARIVAASYSQTFGQAISVSLTAFTDLEGRKEAGIFAGLSMPFGDQVQTAVGATVNHNGQFITADASKALGQEPGSYGWRARNVQGRDQSYRSASGAYRSEYGRMEATVDQFGSQGRLTGELEGAVVATQAGIFLANRVDDAFAVVDVGAPDVEVFHENRSVGKTGSSGKILVPSLRSNQKNRIRIDPNNLPVDANVSRTDEIVVPAEKSGVPLDFGVQMEGRSALVILHDAEGQPLHAGLGGKMEVGNAGFTVGYDGQAYLQDLQPSNTVVIELPEGECRASFAYTPDPGQQVVVGPVQCL